MCKLHFLTLPAPSPYIGICVKAKLSCDVRVLPICRKMGIIWQGFPSDHTVVLHRHIDANNDNGVFRENAEVLPLI